MAAPDALLYSLRVPGQIIIDDKAAELKVHALCCGFGGNEYFCIVPEVIDNRCAPVNCRATGNLIRTFVTREPALVNRLRSAGIIGTTECGDLTEVAMTLQVLEQIILGSPALCEDNSLTLRPHFRHVAEALFQRIQQSPGFSVFGDPMRQVKILFQFSNLTTEAVQLYGLIRLLNLVFALPVSGFIEEVLFYILTTDQFFQPVVFIFLSLLQPFQPIDHRLKRIDNGTCRGCQQFPDHQGDQVALPLGDAVTVLTLQVGRHKMIKPQFIFRWSKGNRDGTSLCVADVLQNLFTQGPFGELLKPFFQAFQVFSTAQILATETERITKQLAVDDRGKTVQLH